MRSKELSNDERELRDAIRPLIEAADNARLFGVSRARIHGDDWVVLRVLRERPIVLASLLSLSVIGVVAIGGDWGERSMSSIPLESETDAFFSPYEGAWPLVDGGANHDE